MIRNVVISLLRQAGKANITAALRANVRDASRILALIA